jgi:hypothetical protein
MTTKRGDVVLVWFPHSDVLPVSVNLDATKSFPVIRRNGTRRSLA